MDRCVSYILGVLATTLMMLAAGCGTSGPTGGTSTPIATTTTGSATITVLVTSSQVTGSVLIENGQSMTGGVAGATIELLVAFTASSSAGQVKEMRVATGVCAQPEQMEAYPWEPFVAEKTYTTTALVNIQGWYVSAQYRDDQGNVSTIYCDDISVEGSPGSP